MSRLIVAGVISCSILYACCFSRRRSVSRIARSMLPVMRSAYRITRPSTLRAARPMVWIKDVSLRRKPSLSASKIATSPHSGISRPSRSKLMPTSTSYTPRRRSRISSIRSSVSTSLCMYRTRSPASCMNSVKSSAMRLVSVVTSVRKPASAVLRHSLMQSCT